MISFQIYWEPRVQDNSTETAAHVQYSSSVGRVLWLISVRLDFSMDSETRIINGAVLLSCSKRAQNEFLSKSAPGEW